MALDLVGRGAGQLVKDLDEAWHLIVGDTAAAEPDHLRRRESCLGPGLDEGEAHLAEPGIRHTANHHLCNGGMSVKKGLDLRRIGVGPADDEHLLEPTGDGEIAVGIETAEIAGAKPPVRRCRSARRGLVVEIALHDQVAAYLHLALFARSQPRAGQRIGHPQFEIADRLARVGRDEVDRCPPFGVGRGTAGLRHAVYRGERNNAETLRGRAHHLGRHIRTTDPGRPDRTRSEAPPAQGLQQIDEVRGDAAKDVDALAADQP